MTTIFSLAIIGIAVWRFIAGDFSLWLMIVFILIGAGSLVGEVSDELGRSR